MKKLLYLCMLFAIFASALGLHVSSARAEGFITYDEASFVWGKGIVFIFDAEGYRNRDVRNASILVGSDYFDLFGWVTKEKDKIVCNAQGGLTRFAGQTAIIFLAGQIFYVTIPGAGGTPALTCTAPEVLGANYEVDFGGGFSGPNFVPGNDLTATDAQASSWFSSFSYRRASGLVCDNEPT